MPGFAPGDPRHVAEARADARQPLVVLGQPPRGLRDQHVGHHVRQVRHGGQHAVVGLGVDRDRLRAEADDQPVQALVEQAAGALGRRQVPGRAVEQVAARGVDARRLGAGDRVAADEARVVDRGGQRALGRPDVGDDRVVARGVQRLGRPASGSAPTGAQAKTASAPSTASATDGAARSIAPRSPRAPSAPRGAGRSRRPRRRDAARGPRARSSRRSGRRRGRASFTRHPPVSTGRCFSHDLAGERAAASTWRR